MSGVWAEAFVVINYSKHRYRGLDGFAIWVVDNKELWTLYSDSYDLSTVGAVIAVGWSSAFLQRSCLNDIKTKKYLERGV